MIARLSSYASSVRSSQAKSKSSVVIHDHQTSQAPLVTQSIRYKTPRPAFIRSTRLDSCNLLRRTRASSRPLPAKTQPFLPRYPLHKLPLTLRPRRFLENISCNINLSTLESPLVA